tara:strand:- start:5403 stop:5864 length:462 start_codon:yes stop_codon:yes gene_type:complete
MNELPDKSAKKSDPSAKSAKKSDPSAKKREIRFYVACLAAYNRGRLHGVWIDATQELDEIQEQVNVMLKESPEPDAEEWAIHDYEGFGSYCVSEYPEFEELHLVASFIEEYPKIGGELLNYFGQFGGTVDEAKEAADEHYFEIRLLQVTGGLC